MKNNLGFTLVELLGVVALLAAIILVSVPTIINTLKKNQEKEYQEFEKAIIRASEIYVERNRDKYTELNTIGGKIELVVPTLITEGYLDQNLKSPNKTDIKNYKVQIEVLNDETLSYIVKGE